MRHYKEYEKRYIGSSDMASLIVAGPGADNEHEIVRPLNFGEDGEYSAYIVDDEAEIGEHYSLRLTLTNWIKIYDDQELVYAAKADQIEIYRAGECGCIIRLIRKDVNKARWEALVEYMDDEIRERVHAELSPCTEAEFLRLYLELDPGFRATLEQEFSDICEKIT